MYALFHQCLPPECTRSGGDTEDFIPWSRAGALYLLCSFITVNGTSLDTCIPAAPVFLYFHSVSSNICHVLPRKDEKKPAMTLVLSMNPFCDHEAEPPCTIYQPVWEPECSGPAHSSSRADTHELHDEPPSRGSTDHVTMSRIAYFKRKYVEDDDLPLNFRSYRRTVSPGLEEQSHVLHLSLDKMRFIDDPEAFLRRSVLINNLLRRLRTEILLQGAWPFVVGSAPVSLTTPVSVHQDRIRKRLRLLHEDEEDECVSACCCFYEASRYMQLPVCVYKRDLQPSSSSQSSQSSSSSAITERLERLFEEDEEEEEEAESEGEEELDSLCPGLDLCEASLKAREGLRERETEGEMMVAVETGQQAALVLTQIGKK